MKRLLLLLVGMFIGTQFLFAQLTVNVTNPTNTTPNLQASYASFAAALTDLNLVSAMSGPITLTLQAGSETAPIKGFVIGSASLNGAISDVNTITINTSGGTVTINAGVGTSLGATASPDGMLVLNGVDYVTIDGITFTDGNSTNATVAMEFGIALFKRAAGDGSNFNTIQNCTFNMQRVNNANGSGPMVEGSVGIGVYNSVYTAGTTTLTPTNGGTLATNGTNSNNKFYGNTINSGNYGIALNGFAATVGVGPNPAAGTFLGDLNNDIGGSSAPTGNTILNFGGAAAASNPSAGIRANNQWSVNISYNTVNNNNGSGVNHVNTLRGINAQAGTSANATITYNNITIKGGGTTSLVSAIENGIGSTAASNTVNINNNTITGEYLTATTGVFYGIYNSSSAATVNANNNSVNGWNYSTAANTGTGAVYPIWLAGAGTHRTANNNTVNNVTRTGTTGGTTIGIYISAGTNQTTNDNTVTNVSIDGTGTTSTMYGIQTTTGTVVMNNNQINNLSCIKTTGTSALYGIYNISLPTNENYNNNTIHTLTHNGTGIVYGIFANTVSGTRTMSGNTVHTLSTAGTTIAGIHNVSSSPNVFKNKVYGITSTSAGAPVVSGILQGSLGASGTANIYNNLIGNLTAPNASGTDAIRGINITTTTTTASVNVYYNTVYINASSTGTNFGTTGIFHTTSTTGTTANLTLRNNIIVNNSTASGTGLVVAYRRSSGSADMLSNYNSASNNNLFYAGTPSATNLIYSDGTSTAQTIAQYKGGVFTAGTIAPRDAASFTENPVFQSTTGSSADFLKIDLTTPTQIESSGQAIVGITDDYWGTVRNVTTPDVGAFEGDMTPPANLTFVSSTTEQASTSFTVVGATNQQIIRLLVVTEGTENPFAVNSITFNTAGSTSAADIANAKVFYTDAATFATTTQFGSTAVSPSGSFTVTGSQTLTTGNNYFWLAYDIAGGATIGNVVDGQCTQFVTSEAKTVRVPDVTDPAGSRNIRGPLAGTYEVGAGKDYTTITQAVTDLNILGVSSAVTFLLTDVNYSTGETFPIIIQKPVRTNPTDLITIRPKAGVSSVVSGSSATGILVLMGADYIVIDGSNSGGTDRSLTWENTSVAANTYAIGLFHNGTVGASNNVIKNNIVKAGSKTVATTWAIILNAAGGGYNNITIQNNELLNAYVGVQFAGISDNAATNGVVTQNVFGNDDNALTLGNNALNTSNVTGLTISNNTIKNLQTGNNPLGIWLSTNTSNTNVTANSISKLYYTGTSGYGGKGIVVNTALPASNILLANNIISDIRGDGWNSLLGDAIVGIRVGAHAGSATTTGGVNIYYNSVNLGSGTFAGNTSGTISAALYLGASTTNINVRNNILANNLVNSNAALAKAYAINSAAATIATIDYNDYYASGTQGVLGFLGSDRANIAAWQTATTQDANSISADPLFRSNTNLQPFNGSPLIDAGTPIVGIDVDYIGDDRDDTNPTIGAYENGYNPPAVDWANVQWPPNGNILEGQTHTVYAQVYESGVTEAPGQGAGIECWIGYNNADTDPSTWAEANWTVASFNTQFGNNDEYAAAIGGNLAAGTYYYASRFRITGGLYQFGGYNGGFWNGETNVSGVLTITNNDITWANLQFPSSANIEEGGSADIYARVFVPSVTANAGASALIQSWIGWSTVDNDPATWTNWAVAGYSSQQGNNDEYMAAIGSTLPVGTYYYASRFKFRDDAFVYGGYSGDGGGFWDGVTYVSGVLTVNPFTFVTSLPWYESYEAQWPPIGWSNSNWDNSKYGTARTGTKWAYSNNLGSQLTTPGVVIPASGIYQFSFWYRAESASYPQDMNVFLSTNGVDFTVPVASIVGATNTTYIRVVFDLSAYNGQTVYFRFNGLYGTGGADWGICVDDVAVRGNTLNWTGTVNNNWHTDGNWNPGFIPTALDNVTIPAGITNYPTLSAAGTVNNILLGSTAAGTASILDNSNLTVSGQATIQRYITGGQYHFASVPLTAAANPTAALFLNSYLWKYDPTIPDWVKYLNATDALTVDQGYMIWYTGANTTYSFTGNMNTGAFTAATPAPATRFNLVPNPYPSAISWTAASGWTKTNIANAIYIYNNNQYASFVGGVGANGGTNIIPGGQAFFVQSTGAAVLAMNNSVRVHSSQAFFNEPVINDLFRVAVSVNGKSDETVVRFTESATASFDSEYDAAKLYGHASAPQLYTMAADNQMLSINSLSMTEGGVSVPLSFEFSADGEITLQFSGVGSFSEQQAIFIEDLFTGSMTNLRQHGNYSFNHLVSNDPDRFLLHFRDITGLDESGAGWQVWSNDRKVYVNIPELNGQRVSIEMFDVLGSRLYSSEGVLSSPTIIRAMNSGVAIIRVSSANRVYTTKLFIQ